MSIEGWLMVGSSDGNNFDSVMEGNRIRHETLESPRHLQWHVPTLHQRITIEQSYNTISTLFFDAESNGEVGGLWSPTPTDVCATTLAAVVLCNLWHTYMIWAGSSRGNSQCIALPWCPLLTIVILCWLIVDICCENEHYSDMNQYGGGYKICQNI